MSSRLYVGNLPFHITEDMINRRFASSGEVKAVKLVLDRESGRSRGFGFVEMGTADAAEKAISDLNGKDFGGRALRVVVAEERRPGGNGAPDFGGGHGGRRGGGRW